MTKKIVSPIVSVLILYFIYWLWLPPLSLEHIEGFFFFALVAAFIAINILVFALDKDYERIIYHPLVAVVAMFFVVLIIGGLGSCSAFHANQLHQQLGTENEISFDDMIHEIDNAQIPIVDDELAQKHADKKIGEDTALGSRVNLGDVNIQEVNGEIMYVAPLEHTDFWKWKKIILLLATLLYLQPMPIKSNT